MNEKRPFIITLIGDISFLGALLSLISSLFPNFLSQFGLHTVPLPIFSDTIIQVLLPLILIIASYGFLKLKIWGYWLLIIYDLFFLISNIIFYHQNKQLFQNVALIFIELVFILPTLKYFIKKTSI